MSRITDMLGVTHKPKVLPDETPPTEEVDLDQKLPFLFEESLRYLLAPDERILATLFVPSERLSDADFRPGRALIVTSLGVFCLEEGEDVIADQRFGVHTRFYPYAQIAFMEIGSALLRGRFALYGTAGKPPTEFILHWYDMNNFRAAMALIRQQIAPQAVPDNEEIPHASVDPIRRS